MKNTIKKIIKWFSSPTMEMEVDGKRYRLVFVERHLFDTMWTVKVKDLSTNKTIGYIDIADTCVTDRVVESVATKEIEKLIQDNKLEAERENKESSALADEKSCADKITA
jgi:hypothetical protein